ncbi:MAG TPA: PEGA domain-containing protein [Candidatus Saccharimonadales bacterium]|jgi:hypothetical protein|nr:PEGA domain-containing protein [Candidatus Saccharimonadales bacterium]
MDFINPKKRQYHKLQLIIGYVLISIMILLMALILLYQARGYGFGKNGQIIQNGLIFVSSTPAPANITLSGVLNGATTNAKLELPAGQYKLELTKAGYHPWVRIVDVDGGSVEYFEYPFLFPTTVKTTVVQQFSAQPTLFTQTPDQHWLLVQDSTNQNNFFDYDLSNPSKVVSSATSLSLPDGLITIPVSGGAQSWQVIGWSKDDQHVLLEHFYQGGQEYILFDRLTPADSINLTKSLNLNSTAQLSLIDGKYNQYYIYDPATTTIDSETLSSLQPALVESHVLAYSSNGSNTIIYITSQNSPADDVNVDVLQSGTNYVIRQLPANSTYLLDIDQYASNWYIAAAATTDNEVYVYKNPMSDIVSNPNEPLVPAYILKVTAPNYLSFSDNFQFVMAENGSAIAVYDAQNQKSYTYQLSVSIPATQHAYWMNSDLLYATANNIVSVFDYDGTNQHTLQPTLSGGLVMFDPTYKWAYTLTTTPPAPAGSQVPTAMPYGLTSTALRIPADQ